MSKHTDRSHITDHALLRYMERVLGMDMEAYRAKMDSQNLRAALKMGVKKVRIDGVEFFCRDRRVITLWNVNKHGKPKSRTASAGDRINI